MEETKKTEFVVPRPILMGENPLYESVSIFKLSKMSLDLCCGPGRHTIPLAKKGFTVTGVDGSGFLLDRAKQLSTELELDVEWLEADMRDFSQPGRYQLAINLLTSFGYFKDENENLKVLKQLCKNLKQGGIAILDMMGKELVAKLPAHTNAVDLEDNSMLVMRMEIINDWTRIAHTWTVIMDGKARTYHLDHSMYSGLELKLMLMDAGFTKVDLYGNWDGSPYDFNASRLIAAAYK